jgi:16S rRNA (guanine(966)-N(2))-methyltransferase RsmD
VISGKYKGRKFFPPKKFPSRPTTDYAKESLFNILENRVYWDEIDVLDLFAGTGSISLEFMSRGAKSVLSVDSHPIAIRHLNKLKNDFEEPQWSVYKKDVFKWIKENSIKFNLIFADPPFGLKGVEDLPTLILENNLLTEDGILVIEHGRETNYTSHPNFKEFRDYGGVNFSFFTKEK